jgi:hypothetical protein
MGHSSCPPSARVRDIPEPGRSHCTRWRRLVFAWFDRHPEATTLFVAQLSGGSGAIRGRGQSQLDADIDGYQRAWERLPATVKHIIVIRDTPKADRTTAGCIERAMDRKRPRSSTRTPPISSSRSRGRWRRTCSARSNAWPSAEHLAVEYGCPHYGRAVPVARRRQPAPQDAHASSERVLPVGRNPQRPHDRQ